MKKNGYFCNIFSRSGDIQAHPLNPSVSISILLIDCHAFVVVLVGRRCSNMKRFNPW